VKVGALCLERLEGQVFASQGAGKGSCCRLQARRRQESGREKARRKTPAQVGIREIPRSNDSVRAVSREVGFV
jgi:hypothetical protein